MDELKKKILKLLKEDARFSASEIAAMVGKTEKEVASAIAEMENSGIIVKYTAVVNTEKTGEDYVDALIEVKVTPQPRRGSFRQRKTGAYRRGHQHGYPFYNETV